MFVITITTYVQPWWEILSSHVMMDKTTVNNNIAEGRNKGIAETIIL